MLRLVLLPPRYLVSKNVPMGLTKIIILHLLDTVLYKCPFHQIYLIVFLKFSVFHFVLFYFLFVLDTFISLASSTYWAGAAYTCVSTSFRLMFNTEYFVREPVFF